MRLMAAAWRHGMNPTAALDSIMMRAWEIQMNVRSRSAAFADARGWGLYPLENLHFSSIAVPVHERKSIFQNSELSAQSCTCKYMSQIA